MVTNEVQPQSIPRAAAWAFTAWMAAWVPIVLWAYGPQNFLWICNLAQFLVLWAVWRDDRLVLSSQAGTVCVIGLVWTLDLLLARVSSLYHVGLPIFVLWLLRRCGYDHRGVWLQCLFGGLAVVAGWQLTEPRRNVNWVHQPFGVEQAWLPEPAFVVLLLLLFPLVIYFPGHHLVRVALARLRRADG